MGFCPIQYNFLKFWPLFGLKVGAESLWGSRNRLYYCAAGSFLARPNSLLELCAQDRGLSVRPFPLSSGPTFQIFIQRCVWKVFIATPIWPLTEGLSCVKFSGFTYALNLRSSCVSMSAYPYLTLRFKSAAEQLSAYGCEPKWLEWGLCLLSLKIRAPRVAPPGGGPLVLVQVTGLKWSFQGQVMKGPW